MTRIFLPDCLKTTTLKKEGLVIVYTGKGKGKTTAALGMALRAIGYSYKVCMIQFIKGSWHYGEMTSSKRLEPEFEITAVGRGFVGIMDDKTPVEEHKRIAQEALGIAKEKIFSKKYDIVILDEVNYAINLNLVKLSEILELVQKKPENVNLVLTGNYAREELIELSDLVTEMKEVKHPFKSGIRAKKGIDF